MSVQVDPSQGQRPDPAAAPPPAVASTTADVLLQTLQPTGAKQEPNRIPQALNICCNGNYGVYLLARRGVQCMCSHCQAERTSQPSAAWIMSPTEFERHSGMPTAKKWRMSIKVAHVGEPELPLGRWLELKGISQQRGQRVSTSPDNSHEQLPQQPQQKPKQQPAGSAEGRDTTDAVRPCASSLARVLLQGLGRDQTGQMQSQSRPGTPQRTSSGVMQQHEAHALSDEPPHCSTGAANSRQAFPIDVAAQLRSCFPSQQAGAAAAAAAAKLEAARVAAYAAAAAEAAAAAAQAEQQVCTQQRQQQHHLQYEQGSNEASPNGGRSSSSSQGGQPRPSPPTLLEIPCPADEPPRHNELAAAALYNSVDPVPLEEAVAAAARGDDSLWLRSPMRRTPCSARQGSGGASRMSRQEAVAAEAFRRLISAHLNPKAAAAAAAAASAAGRAGQQGSSAAAQQGLGSAAAAAAALLAGSLPATAASGPSDGSSSDAMEPTGDAAAARSMGSLLAAAAAAAAAAADEGDADRDDGEVAEGGICVGPEHQADLPHLRPLPAMVAAVALMELKKSGNTGPIPEVALRMALEEKTRSDLLPRDAVEDVWERAASGLALERAQRQRKPPGWQAGYVDPLKPLNAQHNQADSGQQGAANGQEAFGPEADSSKHRKRGNQTHMSLEEALLHCSKKARCGDMGHAGPLPAHAAGLQASKMGHGSFRRRRMSLDGTPLAGCCSEPICPAKGIQSAPRVPPNGFWAPPRQPVYSAPVGPELLSWVLLVPPAAASIAQPAWAAAPAPAAAAAAAAGADASQPQQQAQGTSAQLGARSNDWPQEPAAAAADRPQQHQGAAADGVAAGVCTQQSAAAEEAVAGDATAAAAAAATAAATEGKSNGMEVDTPPQQQQQAEQLQADSEMADAPQMAPVAPSGSAVQSLQQGPAQPAADAPSAAACGVAAAQAETLQAPSSDAAAATAVAAAAAAAPPAPAPTTAVVPAAPAGPPDACMERCGGSGSAVEVRIVLDGCVFVGRLTEVSRLEMARSRVGAAVQPIKQADVHCLPPPGATCVLCRAPEAAGSHMDQAKALRSSGLSNRGLGPLMPVCMPPAKQAASGSKGEQPAGNNQQVEPAAAALGAAGGSEQMRFEHQQQQQAEAGSGPGLEAPVAAAAATERPAPEPAEGGAARAAAPAEGEVVWVHRQCALWSPEVCPSKAGVLMHLPGAIRRGKATRCCHCGQKGATLKCVERSCAQHFHLACARMAGCTLIPEPYAVGCPTHEPKLPELPAAAVLTAFPSSRPAQEQQQPPQAAVVPEHPQLPVLRCRTTRHRALGDVTGSGTPLAGSRDGTFTPLFPGGVGSPMHIDSCGQGADSDFTPRAGSEDHGDMDMPAAPGMLAGLKRSRGGQSRLRHQTNTDWADNNRFGLRPDSPAHMADDGTPMAAAGGRQGSAAKPSNSRGSKGAGGGSARGSYGSLQLHDSRGRFMSHAAAQLLASGFTSTPTASARQHSAGRDAADAADSRGGTPAVSDGPGYSTPRCGTADADGAMSDVSSGAPLVLTEASLGGTTGQPGRAGRCAVCVVQRKGKCGTESAPKKCLRRQLQEQQQVERAKKAAPILSVAAAASAVAIAAAEAEALAAARNSPAPKIEPSAAAAAMARVAAEAEALAAARSSPAVQIKEEAPSADAAPAGHTAGRVSELEAGGAAGSADTPSGATAAAAASDAGQGAQQEGLNPPAPRHDQSAAAAREQHEPAAAALPDPTASTEAEAGAQQQPHAATAAPADQQQAHVDEATGQQTVTVPAQQQQQHPVALGPFQRLLMSETTADGEVAATFAGQTPAPAQAQAAPLAAQLQQPYALQQQQQQQCAAQHMAMPVAPQQLLAAAAVAAAAQQPWAGGQEHLQLLQLLPQPAGLVQAAQAVFGGLAGTHEAVPAPTAAANAATAAASGDAPLSSVTVKQGLVQQC